MRAFVLPAALTTMAACGGDPVLALDAGPDEPVDAVPGPTWWVPGPGETANWDIQLGPPFDVAPERQMVVLDLWDVVPSATTLDHGDGAPVEVPAGPLAGAIADLHARTPPAIVVCHLETGAWEPDAPDAGKFPGAAGALPDNPDPPADGSVIGWSTGALRYLDLSTAGRAGFAELIWKRFDLAKQIGCDALLPDHNDVVTRASGFTVTVEEQGAWFRELASEGHERDLSVGMKDGNTIPGHVDDLADDLDWLVIQRCAEFLDCGSGRPFLNLQKAVFAIDYVADEDGGIDPAVGCLRQREALIADGLIKDVALTAATRTQCGE